MRGGVRALSQGQSEVGFDLRLRLEVERKRAIARAAAGLVGEGEAVALDASTTAYYLALELRAKRELVVVTNGLLVATALADAPGITVLVTGGTLRLSAMSLVGDLGTDVLRTTRINKGFLGARGLSLERGLMDLNPDEVRIKQEMADACEQVYGIFDGTKWHRSALLSFVATDDLNGIVTDSSAPPRKCRPGAGPASTCSAPIRGRASRCRCGRATSGAPSATSRRTHPPSWRRDILNQHVAAVITQRDGQQAPGGGERDDRPPAQRPPPLAWGNILLLANCSDQDCLMDRHKIRATSRVLAEGSDPSKEVESLSGSPTDPLSVDDPLGAPAFAAHRSLLEVRQGRRQGGRHHVQTQQTDAPPSARRPSPWVNRGRPRQMTLWVPRLG